MEHCIECLRPSAKCICGRVVPVDNTLSVLILQFPREQFKPLNSAKLTQMCLKNSRLRVGLSWANLTKAVGRPTTPSNWGVLYLGSENINKPVQILNRNKKPALEETKLEGIIALDGSWKQAKTLWWRNPWLLKLNRIVLNPPGASLRTQAKKQALATAEAVAMALDGLGEDASVGLTLRKYYQDLIIMADSGKKP